MNSDKPTRPYSMGKRAKQAAQTDQAILKAVAKLWLTTPLPEITLEKVADNAGVTVRTILRKFGSKEELFAASIEQDAGKFEEDRRRATPGDLEDILKILLEEYELMGDAVIRTIYVEDQFEVAQQILNRGRQYHREWCREMFAPYLLTQSSVDYETSLTSFVTATEIYLWKLLRKDLGKSKEETYQVFHRLLYSLTQNT